MDLRVMMSYLKRKRKNNLNFHYIHYLTKKIFIFMDDLELKQDIISLIKENKCFLKGDFTLKSGQKSEYYLNLRNLIAHPKIIKKISQLIYHNLPQDDFFICGLPYAGIPYACCLSNQYDIPLLLMRKEKKKHGLKNQIDGCEDLRGKKVVLIDDIMTTGSSIRESIPLLKDLGLEILKIVVIIGRHNSGILISDLPELNCLLTVDDLTN